MHNQHHRQLGSGNGGLVDHPPHRVTIGPGKAEALRGDRRQRGQRNIIGAAQCPAGLAVFSEVNLGWLRNRIAGEQDLAPGQRHDRANVAFAKTLWCQLEPGHRGVARIDPENRVIQHIVGGGDQIARIGGPAKRANRTVPTLGQRAFLAGGEVEKLHDLPVRFIAGPGHRRPGQPFAIGRGGRQRIGRLVRGGQIMRCGAIERGMPDVDIGRHRLLPVGPARGEVDAPRIGLPRQFLGPAHRLGGRVSGQRTGQSGATIQRNAFAGNRAIAGKRKGKAAAVIARGLPGIPMTDEASTVLIEPPGAGTGERGIAVLLAAQGRAVTRDITPDQDAGAIGREPEPGHVGLEGAGLHRSRARCGQVEHPQLVRTRFGREEIEPLAVRAERGAGFAGIGQIGDPFGRAACRSDAPQPRSALVAGGIGIGLLPHHPLSVGRRRWLGHAL